MNQSYRDRLTAIVRACSGRRVTVVGDLIADQFLYGEISRVSREAPVLILRHERTETVPGGAANCAMNLAALGAKVSLIGVVGNDEAGRTLIAALELAGIDCTGIVACDLLTTTKARILAGLTHSLRQQVIRIDYENKSQILPGAVRQKINAHLRDMLIRAEAVIVSDYNYGVVDAEVAKLARELTRTGDAKSQQDKSSSQIPHPVPVLVDSRFRLREFEGFTSATPNEDEVEYIFGRRLDDATTLELAAAELRSQLQLEALLVTRGKNGMLLLEADKPALHIAPVGSRDAVDVTGAGDTVIAAYALTLAAGATFIDAAQLANHAGGIVVMKRGTATVNQEELLASVQHGN